MHPDAEGLVRVVTVQYRKKNQKESKTVCNSRFLITEKVAIHRHHRLDLADEAHEQDAVQGGQGDVPSGVQDQEHTSEVEDQPAVQGDQCDGQGRGHGHDHQVKNMKVKKK